MYGIENRTTVPIEVTLNVSKSKNCAFSTMGPVVKKVVQPNRFETLIQVRRERIEEGMKFEYELKHRVIN